MKILYSFLIVCLLASPVSAQVRKTENVLLITLDGFRWQELFQGADSALMRQQKNLKDNRLKGKFWKESLIERRKSLLPFFWITLETEGQLYGNRTKGNKVNVTNNQWFSYPGYNEILTGHADNERIHSNDKVYNPNTTVLEFLNSQPAVRGKVAAFASWDVFPYIINDKRSGIFVSAGLMEAKGNFISEKEKSLNQIMPVVPNPLGDVRLDAFTFYYGLEYMKKNKPRVMYFAFDETDDFAHGGEYGAYLNSAHNTDKFIGELWNYVQSDLSYKNKTTLIITSDHGRGANSVDWKNHDARIENADQIWIAVIGPDTPATGEVKTNGQFYQNQIAQTMARFLGLTYTNAFPVGEAISTVFIK